MFFLFFVCLFACLFFCLFVCFFSQSGIVLRACVILHITLKGFLKDQIFSVSPKVKQDGGFLNIVPFLTCCCFRSRQRRSSGMVFSPSMVHLLPGYPKQSPEDPEVTMIAFYLSLPSDVSQASVLSKDILITVIKINMPSIGRSMDGSIVSVDPSSPLSIEFQTSHNRNNKSEANRTVTVGGIVGGCLFVVVIAALLVVYVKNRR